MTTTTTYPANPLNTWYGGTIAYHSSTDANGSRLSSQMTESRDKTLIFVDNSGFLNFATDAHNTIDYRVANGSFDITQTSYPTVSMDLQDNFLLMGIEYISNVYYIKVVRYTKPAAGWNAWAKNASRPALSRTTLVQYRPATNGNSYNSSWMNTAGFFVCKAANITNGVLYVATVGALYSSNSGSYTNYIGYTFNLTSGSVITTGALQGNGNYYPAENSTVTGQWGNVTPVANSLSAQQFAPYGSSGYFWRVYNSGSTQPTQDNIYNSTTSNTSRYTWYYHKWIIDANGNLTTEAQGSSSSYAFKIINDVEAASGNISTFSYSTTFSPTNGIGGFGGTAGENVLFCRIKNAVPVLDWAYNTSTGTPNNYTYSATPTNWVFTTGVAPTIVWIPETNKVRMYASNGTTAAYMDITWTGSTFTFPATATVIASTAVTTPLFTTATPMLDVADVWKSTTLTPTTSGVSTSYTITTNGSIPEPYVSTLKANNGMKFIHTTASINTTANTAAFGTTLNFLPNIATFQFKRVSSGGGTEYYNYTTNAFTSSVVNNSSALYPGGGGYLPSLNSVASYTHDLSGTWADNTSYVYSIVYTDANSIASTSSTRTIATPAVSAAPTAPTPRRLFVFPLQAKTSSHILSIENRVLINKIHIVNTSGSSPTVSLNLGGFDILSTQTLAAYQTLQINTAITAAVAERLLATCSADSAITLWIMGTEGV